MKFGLQSCVSPGQTDGYERAGCARLQTEGYAAVITVTQCAVEVGGRRAEIKIRCEPGLAT